MMMMIMIMILLSYLHHLVFGINFQINLVSLISPVSIYRLIHLSTHPCHHRHSQLPSLLHSFTRGSKPTFSTNPSHLNFTPLLRTAFIIMGLDRTYHVHQFIFSIPFTFFIRSVWWTQLATRQLSSVRYCVFN